MFINVTQDGTQKRAYRINANNIKGYFPNGRGSTIIFLDESGQVNVLENPEELDKIFQTKSIKQE